VTNVEKPFDLEGFIHQKAEHLIGENGIVGTCLILFEFIDEEGRGGFSVLRPPGVDWVETMSTLGKATKVILESYEKDLGIEDDDSEDY